MEYAEKVVDASILLLERSGVTVENADLLGLLSGYGAIIHDQIARFPEHLSRALLQPQPQEPPGPPKVTAVAEMYEGKYLSLNGEYEDITEENWLEYLKLSKHLPGLSGMVTLGCPISGVPDALQPLYEKLYCWKWGASGGDAIWDSRLLHPLLDLWQARAAHSGRRVEEVFRATVYMLSPLKLGAVEAGQVMFFHRHGLQTQVGTMCALGSSAPVTHAGAQVVQLAERMFTVHLSRALFGRGRLCAGNNLGVTDMATAAFCYGRPESNQLIREAAYLARKMGLPQHHHAGLTDAHTPSFEAGVQKTASALLAAIYAGHGNIAAGLLAVDAVCSPVQMALDGELCSFLNKSLAPVTYTEDDFCLDALLVHPHGDTFLDQEHTAMHARALWQPNCFTRRMLDLGTKTRQDAGQRAADLCRAVLREKPPLEPLISAEEERDILQIIKRSEQYVI